MVNGVLKGIEHKLSEKEQQELISRKQEVIADAYQQRVHLLKLREDMLRKVNWKKTQ
jgi:hypothetical protein